MRIGIMGAGAIGCNVGGMLARAGHDITFIDQWPAHVEAMRTTGLKLSGTWPDYVVPAGSFKALHLYEAQSITEPFDAAFLAVKGYDTEWATMFILRFLKEPDGVIVDFQNGINDERVAAVAGRHRTLGCVITIGAGLYEPGVALRTDPVGTDRIGFKIGELDGQDTPRARELVEIMNAVTNTKLTTNLFGERWSKLAANSMGNPVAGLSGLGTAELRTNATARRISIHVAAEVVKVARAAGHQVEAINTIAPQRYVDGAEGKNLASLEEDLIAGARFSTGAGRPSLLQDVIRGRRTEIEDLNGLVVAEGKRLGIATPFNEAIVLEVNRHGVGTLQPDIKNLDPIAKLLPVAQAIPA
ncbi:MAG: 2-dehydropantoate 2-reductase [Chloroflexi bacterium]|nr:2-dehydropantoate 2-reductase [Chloroflexota bacterium]